jgi:hypothetical protein
LHGQVEEEPSRQRDMGCAEGGAWPNQFLITWLRAPSSTSTDLLFFHQGKLMLVGPCWPIALYGVKTQTTGPYMAVVVLQGVPRKASEGASSQE